MGFLRRCLVFVSLASFILAAGCIGNEVTIVQKLDNDVDGVHPLSIELLISEQYMDQLQEALDGLGCDFEVNESSQEDLESSLYYSKNCLAGGDFVSLRTLTDDTFRYEFNTSFFKDPRYSQIPYLRFVVEVPERVIKTNGIKYDRNHVEFSLTPSVIKGRLYYVEYGPLCYSSDECLEDEVCEQGDCVTVECPECHFWINKTCVKRDCCSDWDCNETQYCAQGICEEIDCGCGQIVSHKCEEFECCSDGDCGKDHACYENSCVEVECRGDGECSDSQFCETFKCVDLDCLDDEYVDSHACQKLSCGMFEIPQQHLCVTNYIMVLVVVVCTLSFLGLAVGVTYYLRMK